MNITNHKHEYLERGNKLICECGKYKLNLKRLEEGIKQGVKSNGINYSVRDDRSEYFFPQQWIGFINNVKKPLHKFYYSTLLNTGARSMEALNLQKKDFEIDRGTITLKTVKHSVAKKDKGSIGKARTFFIASNYIKEAKKMLKNYNDEDYIFLNNEELPGNYNDLKNSEKKNYYFKKQVGYSQLFKRTLRKTKVEERPINPKDFSLHNIRKTYGNWMRIYDLKTEEILYRLGHDFDTYISNYGSALIFTDLEKQKIMKILGDVK